jgi:LysM repeat protein
MKKLFLVVFIGLSAVLVATAQNNNGSFITHKVEPKESLFSLGRKYNLDPKVIAAFNNFPADKGLVIGQVVKIPSHGASVAAAPQVTQPSGNSPVRHTVAKGETLFKIAKTYNVSIEDIQKWNNLASTNIPAGTTLSIYAKGQNETTSLATNNTTTPAATNNSTTKTNVVEEAGKPATETKKEEPVVAATKPEEKTQEVTQQPAETPTAKTEAPPANNQTSSISNQPIQQQTSAATSNEKKIDLLTPLPETAIEGAFAQLYPNGSEKSLTNKTGDAATFKSSSGWQDKKYYVLMNDVTPGTILKISYGDNKVVFAKVLGSLPDVKEDRGLLLRMSNAAASYLGISDPKFPVQVTFYQ